MPSATDFLSDAAPSAKSFLEDESGELVAGQPFQPGVKIASDTEAGVTPEETMDPFTRAGRAIANIPFPVPARSKEEAAAFIQRHPERATLGGFLGGLYTGEEQARLESVGGEVPKFDVSKSTTVPGAVLKQAANVAVGLPEFMETPAGGAAAVAGLAAPVPTALAFAGLGTKNTAESIARTAENFSRMGLPQKAAALGVEIPANIAMTVLPMAGLKPRLPLSEIAAATAKGANARSQQETTEVHGDVRSQQQPPGTLPQPEGGQGVQPGTVPAQKTKAQQQGVLLANPVAEQLGRSIDTITGEEDASAHGARIAQAVRGKVISAEEARALRQQLRQKRQELGQSVLTQDKQEHVQSQADTVDVPIDFEEAPQKENEPFSATGEGSEVATIDRKNGRIIIRPSALDEALAEDVAPGQERNYIRSLLFEERVHLGTTEAQASEYGRALSRWEQSLEGRLYGGKGWRRLGLTPEQIGWEAIRRRIQRLHGMDSTETARVVGVERWSLKGMEMLNDILRGVREKIIKRGGSAKAIESFNKVLSNLDAGIIARGGAPSSIRPTGATADEAQSAAKEIGWTFKPVGAVDTTGMPPELAAQIPKQWEFTDKRPDSPTSGLTFYVREGASKEQIIQRHAEKVGAKQPASIRPTEETGEKTLPLEVIAAMDNEQKADQRSKLIDEVISTLPEYDDFIGSLEGATPAMTDIIQRAVAAGVLDKDFLASGLVSGEGPDEISQRFEELAQKGLDKLREQRAKAVALGWKEGVSEIDKRIAAFEANPALQEQAFPASRRPVKDKGTPELMMLPVKPGAAPVERPSAAELGATPFDAFTLNRAGYGMIQAATDRVAEQIAAGETPKAYTFADYKRDMRAKFGPLKPGQLYESFERNAYRRLFNASGENLKAIAQSLGIKTGMVSNPPGRLKFELGQEAGSPQARAQIKAEQRGAQRQQGQRNALIGRIADKLLQPAVGEIVPRRTILTPEDLASPEAPPVQAISAEDFLGEPEEGGEGAPAEPTAEAEPTETFEPERKRPGKGPVFMDITTRDLKSGALPGQLVQGARRSSRDPVSVTKRVTALLEVDPRTGKTGKVYLVSTFADGRRGTVLLDPTLSGMKKNRPFAEIVKRYRPVASILLDEPVSDFRQAFDSLKDFENKFGTDARRMSSETYPEPPKEGEITARRGTWEGSQRMTDAEALAIVDHIERETGQLDSPEDVKASLSALLSDLTQQRTRTRQAMRVAAGQLERAGEKFGPPPETPEDITTRTALSAYRKLAARIIAKNPNLTDREVFDALATQIYDTHQTSTGSETEAPSQAFIRRTLEQANPPTRPATPIRPSPPARTGARELTLPRFARRGVPGEPGPVPATIPRGLQQAPFGAPERLSPEAAGVVAERATAEHPYAPTTFEGVPPGLEQRRISIMPGARGERPGVKEPSSIRDLTRLAKDEIDRAGDAVRMLTTRSAMVGDLARTLDQVDNTTGNLANEAENRIRMPSAQKPTGMKALTTPWQRGKRAVLSAANVLVEAEFNRAKLAGFRNQLTIAEGKARALGASGGWRERRLARAWQRDIEASRAEIDYAQAHWSDRELQETARRTRASMNDLYNYLRQNGINLRKQTGFVPHRFLNIWDGAQTLFQLPRIMGTKYRAPRTFQTHYDALEAGPYMRVTHDVASLVQHAWRRGLRDVSMNQWREGLKSILLPGNEPLAMDPKLVGTKSVSPNPAYKLMDLGGGEYIAIHRDYEQPIRGLLAPSAFEHMPVARGALHLTQQLKHSLLIGDFFHLARTLYYGTSILGTKMGLGRSGWSALDIADRDLPEAVAKGIIRPQDAAWAQEPVQYGTQTITRKELIQKFYREHGANLGRVQDALYKDLITDLTPTTGIVKRGISRAVDPSIGRYNRFLFDKLTRGLMAESVAREFERQQKAKPNANPDALMRDIAKDVNNYFGNIGRQGLFKSKTAQDITRLFFLAPQWVEGLARKEATAYNRLSGVAKLTGQRQGVTALGTTGRSIGRAMVFMVGLTQAINLITRGKPTWQNDEEGHKLDAWIPAWGSDKEGFWFSPLSIFNELTHDLYRLIESKPTFAEAATQIMGNKESPLGRSLMVMGTGKTPTGEQTTTTMGRLGAAGKAIVPLPITFGKYAQLAGHAVAPGTVPAVQPGQIQRQMFGSLGTKIEPALTSPAYVQRLAKRFMTDNNLTKESGWVQIQTDEPSYTKLRAAIRANDDQSALKVMNALRKTHTDAEILKAMRQHSIQPFTGSAKNEKLFLYSLNEKELDQYSLARERLMTDFEKFADFYLRQP